ncbi:MAG: hypothetical protein JWL90_301 [Chthoniobacteraceae bacterium]|nr:hypothetical protein [Chthoniobacteraceae bacterium]
MYKNRLLIFTMAGALGIAACERKAPVVIIQGNPAEDLAGVDSDAKTRTRETNKLGQAIDEYAAHPTAEAGAEVKKRFASLDGEVAELELFVAKSKGVEREEANAKLRNLQAYRASEAARFGKLPANSAELSGVRVDSRTGAEKAEQKARDIGDTIEAGAKRAGDSIKEAAERTKDAVKDAVQ